MNPRIWQGRRGLEKEREKEREKEKEEEVLRNSVCCLL